MAAVTRSGMRAAEASALAAGWSEEQLINLAGSRLGHAITRHFPHPGTAVAYLGKGHNAADTLVALRVLRDDFGWKIALRNAFTIERCAPLTQEKWLELGIDVPLNQGPPWQELRGPLLLLDGLIGIGVQGELRHPLLPLVAEMEWLRQHAAARVAAIDLPSGIDPDTGEATPGAVTADVTFMIGNAKKGLLMGHAANSVGSLALVPLEILTIPDSDEIELIAPQTMEFGKSPRPYDFHKGQAGRVSIVAGSASYPGAAALAATGSLRGGAGLITLHVPEHAAAVITAKCPPEIIVRGFASHRELWDIECDAIVVGCGIGELDASTATSLLDWIENCTSPTVIDADALNLIAKSGRMGIFNDRHVITPHPGEFARLAPDLAGLPRESAARIFAARIAATLMLKGSRTLVARYNQALWCNACGSPGMATGGQGDLLAGVIGARLAIGDTPPEAAALGAWLCGRAAEIALDDPSISQESLTPSDTAHHLGAAFQDWKCAGR